MRLLPSSRSAFAIRLSLFDSAWAGFAPLFALYLRDAPALSYDGLIPTLLYCALSVAFSLVAFSAFRIKAGMTRYFSVLDSIDVTKAVLAAAMATYVVGFSLTRLDGIPRTTPIIHALILLTGLIGIRITTRLIEAKRTAPHRRKDVDAEHILIIGSNRLSLLYIKFLRAYSPGLHRIMAVLDDRPEMLGRAIDGVRIVGPVKHLESVITEFAEHGVRIGHVIVGGDPDMLYNSSLPETREICSAYEIKLDFVPKLVGLDTLLPTENRLAVDPEKSELIRSAWRPYFIYKRYFDLLVTATAILLFSPLWLLVGAIALLDIGSPIFFWQQRLGEGGRSFMLYKIRTLTPPYDEHGRRTIDAERLSAIGRILRKCRFDEAPQLLNVLVGDMSLVGPRPLLPRDQPPDPTLRLSVRPGITGWAQVNGGKLLSAEEKTALDEWYVRNASLWLDLRILYLTLLYIFKGERRSESTIAEARGMWGEPWGALAEARIVPVGVAGKLANAGTSSV